MTYVYFGVVEVIADTAGDMLDVIIATNVWRPATPCGGFEATSSSVVTERRAANAMFTRV